MSFKERIESLQIQLLEVQLENQQTQLESTRAVCILVTRKATAETEKAELERDRERLYGEEIRKAIAANDLPKIKSFNS